MSQPLNTTAKCFFLGLTTGRIEAARVANDGRVITMRQEFRTSFRELCRELGMPELTDTESISRWLYDHVGRSASGWFLVGHLILLVQSLLKTYALLAQSDPAAARVAVPTLVTSLKNLQNMLVGLSAPDWALGCFDQVHQAAVDIDRLQPLANELRELSDHTVMQLGEYLGSARFIDIDVFVSHSGSRIREADQVTSALEKEHISVWHYRRNAVAGIPHLEQTKAAIERCRVFVCIIGENDWNSLWMGTEVLTAAGSQRPRIPVLCETQYSQLPPEWHQAFGTAVGVQFPPSGPPEIAIRRIVDGVKRFLN